MSVNMLKRIYLLLTFFLIISACAGIKPEEEFNFEKWLERAQKHIDKSEFDEARKLLLEVKNRDNTLQYGPAAQLKIAESYVKEDEPDLAIEEYRKFIKEYTDHSYAPYAQYQIAILYFNRIEGPERGYGFAQKALEEFKNLKRLYPRNPYGELVDIRIEKCRQIIAQYEFMVGKFYFKKDSFKAAIGRLEGLRKDYPDFDNMPEVLYLLWKSYLSINEQERADEILNLLITKYPHTKEAKKAKKR